MSGNDDWDDHSIRALRSACEEGRETVNHQVEWIRQIDQKAIRVFRANILLLGLILTALSIPVRVESFAITPYVNVHSIIGVLLIIGSTALAGLTYISSRYEGGIDWSDIDESVDGEYSEKRFLGRLSYGYSRWIEYNDLVVKANAILVTVTILLVIDAAAFLTVGVVIGSLGLKGTNLSYGFLSGALPLAIMNYAAFRLDSLIELYYSAT